MKATDPGVEWLLGSGNPSLRYFALTDLLGKLPNSAAARQARAAILDAPWVCALLAGQKAAVRVTRTSLSLHPGGFGVPPYKKWDGAHWRLVSLVELGIPPGEPRACAAADQVLQWLNSDAHTGRIQVINGLMRRCASQEGNALAVCCRLGLAGDPRVQRLAASLIRWQWPDGGWNCDPDPRARHSSFYESLATLWGLSEYYHATGSREALAAAQRAAELFLRHRLFRSEHTGEVIDAGWLRLHYPLYWHYDILQALVILSRLGPLSDPRMQEALDLVAAKRQPDGCWRAEAFYWQAGGTRRSNVDVVDWGRRGPNGMITLNALRILQAAGRAG